MARGLRIALGQGVYSVNEVCRILRPKMTPRKVHYWLDTGLLGRPIRRGRAGMATLLSFEQLVKVRTLQRLRDDLGFSLQHVRKALAWLLASLFNDGWQELHFFRNGQGKIAVANGQDTFALGSGQGVLEEVLPELRGFLAEVRAQWEEGKIQILDYPRLVSDANVMGGSPVIAGTRIETAFVAHLASAVDLGQLQRLFPHVDKNALTEAARFEGVQLAA